MLQRTCIAIWLFPILTVSVGALQDTHPVFGKLWPDEEADELRAQLAALERKQDAGAFRGVLNCLETHYQASAEASAGPAYSIALYELAQLAVAYMLALGDLSGGPPDDVYYQVVSDSLKNPDGSFNGFGRHEELTMPGSSLVLRSEERNLAFVAKRLHDEFGILTTVHPEIPDGEGKELLLDIGVVDEHGFLLFLFAIKRADTPYPSANSILRLYRFREGSLVRMMLSPVEK